MAPPLDPNIQRILHEFGDTLSMLNIAPETSNAASAIQFALNAGKIVTLGFSAAAHEDVERCLRAGASVLAHTWRNQSPPRQPSGVNPPGLDEIALADDRVRYALLPCDGVSVHPALVRVALRCRGAEGLCVVSQSVPRAGLSDGTFSADDGQPALAEGGVGFTKSGQICGTAVFLPDMFRNLVNFAGIAPHQAIRTVTQNPASCLGLEQLEGTIAPGRVANLVAWDTDLRVERVWREGSEVAGVEDSPVRIVARASS